MRSHSINPPVNFKSTLPPSSVPDVDFIAKIKDVKAFESEDAIFQCVLSTPLNRITWSKEDSSLEHGDKYEITVSEDKLIHTLRVKDCKIADDGAYYAIAGITTSSASLKVEADPNGKGRKGTQTGNQDDLIKLALEQQAKLQKQKDNLEAARRAQSEKDAANAGDGRDGSGDGTGGKTGGKTEGKTDGDEGDGDGTNKNLLTDGDDGDDGNKGDDAEDKKNKRVRTGPLVPDTVIDKPTPPQGPVDILESAVTSVEFKWKPPKDDGGCPVTNYIIDRQQIGRNKWSNLGEIPGSNPSYKDSDVNPGRRYCYRIRAKNSEGISDYLQSEDIPAGVLRYPGSPTAPKVVSAFKDCINLTWCPPCDTGGTKIVGYNLEKNKKGTNYWSLVNQGGPITDTKFAVEDVIEGAAYEFRVSAINLSGAGHPSLPCDTVIARDPMKPPGKVTDLKLTSSNYTTFSLAWTKPKEIKGVEDEAQGYYVEIRPIENLEWTRCNAIPIPLTSYNVHGLKAMATYWVRVIATNYGGDGEPQGFDNYIIAMPPPVKPNFKDRKMKTFVVVRSGNTVRLNINFEASPVPQISWLKDGIPVAKHVTITNSDKGSQLLIPTSERSDSGIYTIMVKNIVGQASINVEIRVTDDPKPPGPVELEQNTPGTVTLSWTPSPDEKRDDRLHYMVSKRDSFKHTWRTVADNLFNNKFTIINILPGREYNFRVFAKNDIGPSPPSESPMFGTKKEKGLCLWVDHKVI
ncbi:hypothetical protein EPR50_G00036110 [Perca flavescens]|uniref:Uncharacterized protein n=1 Tax=Perca flavescens TaxID=8167 RepID=A0A484DEY3_PERFV|nr:hypothetical protein EPR50_G00036110 [Perca flavescens]